MSASAETFTGGPSARTRVDGLLRMLSGELRNRGSRVHLPGKAPVVVSMTTFGPRLATVHLALESIMSGTVLPRRLILWVDDSEELDRVGPALRRLQDRGLEVRIGGRFGPHGKYFPYVRESAGSALPLVTADDDVLYDRRWLETLVERHAADPHAIHCYRAHRVGIDETGLAPYMGWRPWQGSGPHRLAFLTGVSGAIYPPEFLDRLRERGDDFLKCAPRADDVWLNAMAVRTGTLVSQVHDLPVSYPTILYSQRVNLNAGNGAEAGNDRQLRATFTDQDLSVLRGAAAVGAG